MQLKLQEKFNRKLTEPFAYKFEIEEDGFYAIEITASGKNWQQNLTKFVSFFKDDDLTVKINNIEFPKLNGRSSLFDGEVAWNGNNLNGLKKTDIFLINLEKGNHTIQFLIDQQPYLEDIKIYSVKDQNFEIKERQAEDGNRRQWITLILNNLSLKNISVTASALRREKDDDDLKLIINGEIQRNAEDKSHKYWYWCGRILQGKKKDFTNEINLSQGLHYIELWADRRPVVREIKLELDLKQRARVVWDYTVLREAPNTNAQAIVENINKGEKVIIIEKTLRGERIRNKSGALLGTNRWHKVQYKNQEGYIYSMALEIDGEDKNTIQRFIAKEAKILNVDPEIVLALAECESQFFPYTVSYDEKRPEIAFGVMQLSLDLITDLNDKTKSFYSPINNVFEIEQNIKGGLKYFDYLYNGKYKNDKDKLRKAVAAYNTGPGDVPVDQSLNLDLYENQTQRLVKCVSDHLKNKTFQKLLSIAKKTGLVLFFSTLSLFVYKGFLISDLNISFNPNPANTLSITESGDIYYQEKYKFPNVVWDKNVGQISFFGQAGNLVTRISSERLNLDQIFNTSPEFQSKDSIHIGDEILEFPKNVFYFLASTFGGCGAQNCHWVLYQFNINENDLKIIDGDIFGATSLYLSPDSKTVAITRSVHGGICNSGDYLTTINLENFQKNKIDWIMDHTNYQVNLIQSVLWKDNQKLQIKTYQFNCKSEWKKPLEKIQIIMI